MDAKKVGKLLNDYIQVKTALDALKAQEKNLKDALYPYVDAEDKRTLDTPMATLKILPGHMTRKVDYAGLRGFSEDVYQRFVTTGESAPSLRITVKK